MTGVINTIFGRVEMVTSNADLKAQARNPPLQEPVDRRFKLEETITFSAEDTVPMSFPQNVALIISCMVANKQVRRDHVDSGSEVNVIYINYFRQLGIDFGQLRHSRMPLVGFIRQVV